MHTSMIKVDFKSKMCWDTLGGRLSIKQHLNLLFAYGKALVLTSLLAAGGKYCQVFIKFGSKKANLNYKFITNLLIVIFLIQG